MSTKKSGKANDHWPHTYATGTEQYYRTIFGFVYTDGVKLMCELEKCFWFLDIITSYQFGPQRVKSDYQKWTLKRVTPGKNEFVAECKDIYTGELLITQDIPLSDFEYDEMEMYLKDKVIFLPSED